MCRCADFGVAGTDGQNAEGVTEASLDLLAPGDEFGTSLLEAVIAMSEFAGGQGRPADVVFGVGSGENYGTGPGEFEEGAFEGIQPVRVEMLDDFNNGGGIEPFEAPVAVGK